MEVEARDKTVPWTYEFIRKDSQTQTSISVDVLDTYPDEKVTMVLLRDHQRIKKESQVVISGLDENRKTRALGNCRVEKKVDGIMFCRLPSKLPYNMSHLKAHYHLKHSR